MTHAQTDGMSPPSTTNAQSGPKQSRSTIPPSRGNQSAGTPRASSAHSWLRVLRRPRTSPGPRPQTRDGPSQPSGYARRDSGLDGSSATPATPAAPSPRDREANVKKISSLPTIIVQNGESGSWDTSHGSPNVIDGSSPAAGEQSMRITTQIPTGDFAVPSLDTLQFNNRGSVMMLGKDVANGNMNARTTNSSCNVLPPRPETSSGTPPRLNGMLRIPPPRGRLSSGRVISMDDAMLSRKVRSMYEYGDERAGDWDRPTSSFTPSDHELVEEKEEEANEEESPVGEPFLLVNGARSHDAARPTSSASCHGSILRREPHEVAGGIEDWQDVSKGQVDRYGFILPKPAASRDSSNSDPLEESPGLVRVATSLQLASESPRRKRTIRRPPSSSHGLRRKASKRSVNPPASVHTNHTVSSARTTNSVFRNATNRLPHNRERRLMDEAGDMLTLPRPLAELTGDDDEREQLALLKRKKEWEREEKWRKMGKAKTKGAKGGGMEFDFDTKDAKLISRTWKGIPDKWRAAAWYSFLETSVRKTDGAQTHEELVEQFHELQDQSSPDDMQIDVDVPRTIGSHIMFRRRYRGGQRLLFRVLHALSLYLPETGYVQGMAALAATFLCYYDEENAFVMMVRLWQHRGLDLIYRSGFGGLMETLEEFEKHWLVGGDVAQKLEELGVASTSYGTRWYLTLFNYSIPFPAQLRVWDVFLLLGDAASAAPTGTDAQPAFGGDLDVLHATSAALIDATREILLDSDFENAMKTLTSFLPIKDEDLLMRVAKAEWRQRRKKMGKQV